MKTAILDVAPETPGEELRYESALRAVHVHERAKSFRTVAIVVVFAITTARICLAPSLGLPKGLVDTQVVNGICLLASLFTFSLEWSTRLQRQDRLQAYARYLISHRQLT